GGLEAVAEEMATAHAERGDRAACVGKCAFAVVACAQARLLRREEWALNEKGIVGRAGLGEVESLPDRVAGPEIAGSGGATRPRAVAGHADMTAPRARRSPVRQSSI